MKDSLKEWLKQLANVAGVQACGLLFPDQTTFSQTSDAGFPLETLPNVWACVAETIRTAGGQRLPAGQLRWVYEHSLLQCLRRQDGVCLMVFCTRKPQQLDSAALQRLLAGFQQAGI